MSFLVQEIEIFLFFLGYFKLGERACTIYGNWVYRRHTTHLIKCCCLLLFAYVDIFVHQSFRFTNGY